MTPEEVRDLEQAIEHIVAEAREFKLDFFEMRYEICPADVIYTFGAYAMPIRFHHWSFGKSFHRMKMDYDYGMSKIYELVINSDPCYAFLLETNSLLQNKLIAAHVLAHCDFFKHNWRFRDTNRQMVWTMAAFAERVRQYEQDYGRDRVEQFLDAVLAIQEHIDPFPQRAPEQREPTEKVPARKTRRQSPYDDLWSLDKYAGQPAAEETVAKGEPGADTSGGPGSRDLLLYLMEHGQDLDDWQRDIISSIRAESLYFRPQMETKIMNEGWASTWHARIMRQLDLTPDESVEFAKMHAGVLAPNKFHLNPYHLGFHIFADIEERFGTQKMFEVREVETDLSFLRNYLTEALVEKLDLYLYQKVVDRWEVSHNAQDWERVRDGIVALYANCGFPYIYAEQHDYGKRGELFLRHGFEGVELDPEYLRRTLPHLHHIWGRPVHLETVEDGASIRYTCAGQDVERFAGGSG